MLSHITNLAFFSMWNSIRNSLLNIETRCTLDGQISIPSVGKELFLLHNVQTDSGTHPRGTGALSAGVKRPICKAVHTSPFSAEVKNV
jgi:hypothetical protein